MVKFLNFSGRKFELYGFIEDYGFCYKISDTFGVILEFK